MRSFVISAVVAFIIIIYFVISRCMMAEGYSKFTAVLEALECIFVLLLGGGFAFYIYLN